MSFYEDMEDRHFNIHRNYPPKGRKGLVDWIQERISDLTKQKDKISNKFYLKDKDEDLDKLISISGKITAYREVLDFIRKLPGAK